MSDYELAPGAELDVLDIALYTIKKWGVEQADRYEAEKQLAPTDWPRIDRCPAASCETEVAS